MTLTMPIRFFLILVLALCAHPAIAQSIRPVADRLDAIVSYPLVIAIAADDERDLRSPVETKLDDGRVMRSTPYWVGISPQYTQPGWTSAPGVWTATTYESISKLSLTQRPVGAWFINIQLPIDAVGQGLWIDATRYELNWLPDPERTSLEVSSQSEKKDLESFWALKLPSDARNDPAIQSAIDQYHHNPLENWRALLLTNGLDPALTRTREPGSGTDQSLESLDLELSMDTPGADLLRTLARQNEARWQIILGRIWLIDPDAAVRLKTQLMRTARFGDRTLPLWEWDSARLAQLAHDLLSPFVDDRTRVLRANAWLETRPRALAWIIDDQGQIEVDSGRFIATLGTLSLPQSPGTSLLRVDAPARSGSTSPELATLSPYRSTPINITIDPIELAPSNPTLETQPVRIRTGRWSATRQVIASPTPARPPYVRIGPLLNDWTMRSLLTNRPLENATTPIASSAAGILRRVAPPSRTDQTVHWQLYFELTSSNLQSPNESLTLWVGPYTNPFAVWTLRPNGQVEFLRGSRLSIGLPMLTTRILDDRWVAMIDLPSGVFDEDQILQLGIERTDARGVHTAWPRRMIPDQPEPGRLTIEGNRFDGLNPN
jgi:hypothetical protein